MNEMQNYIDEPSARLAAPLTSIVSGSLNRIRTLQSLLGAFITITSEQAIAESERIEHLRESGTSLPLYGLTLAVKDNIDVSGVSTTLGSSLYRSALAKTDAEVIRRLRNAGALVLGKTSLYEFAYGVPNDSFPTCRNAWDPRRIPGGSSSGSAVAVAADLCIGALGTDTGGSVRLPASLNGITGLKPTLGRISNRGVFPLARPFDTVGPMARSARDVAAMLSVMEGYDPADPRSQPAPPRAASESAAIVNGIRVGIPREFFFEGLESDVERGVNSAIDTLKDLGAVLKEVALPGAAQTVDVFVSLMRAEAAAVHHGYSEKQLQLLSPEIRRRLKVGEEIPGWQVCDLTHQMYVWRRVVQKAFDSGVDILVTPANYAVAPAFAVEPSPSAAGLKQGHTITSLARFLHCWSLANSPALSIPCGFSTDGMPIGLQLIGRPWSEHLLLMVATAFQDATDWHRRRPPDVDASSSSS
jgi:aspartyl-tRNA(Asn)/glutamyl-tRNA(Gln) amidotransferase subunit A